MSTGTTKQGDMVWRLLRRNISAGQLLGYAVATLVGLSIISVALQFYRDVTSIWHDEDKLFGENYIVISKRVSGLGGLFGGNDSSAFSPDEIASIGSQPWARKVGAFKAADFNVNASATLGSGRLSTSLFLETIPDEFFDVTPREWDYNPSRGGFVPVIIPKDYLALYNFGYATAHGMPQLSESMIGMLPLKLSLSGNGEETTVDARIVGFSSRLNTIAVPESFLDDANRRFSPRMEAPAPSRLIVKVADKGDPAINAYLSDKGYEQGGEATQSGQLTFFLKLTTSVVVAIGVVITLLSFFILVLSIYLLLQKNRRKIHDMMLLGYFPADIARVYARMVTVVNIAVLVLSAVVVIIAQLLWSDRLAMMHAEPSALWPTFIVMFVVMTLLTLLSMLIIRRKVRGTFRLS